MFPNLIRFEHILKGLISQYEDVNVLEHLLRDIGSVETWNHLFVTGHHFSFFAFILSFYFFNRPTDSQLREREGRMGNETFYGGPKK